MFDSNSAREDMLLLKTGMVISFTYTNYKGETEERRVAVGGVAFGRNNFHPEPCWLLLAYDMQREAHRTFDLSKIDVATLRQG